jgi:hypothetical protein
MRALVFLHHAANPNGRVLAYSVDVPLPIAVVPEWCQKHPAQTPEHPLHPCFWLTYAKPKWVTDGTRTRVLRSHNPCEHIRVCPNMSRYVT